MYKATKEFKWDMAHRLPTHWWKCFNVHWHTYRALITIRWEKLQEDGVETGMIKDFSNFKPIKDWIDNNRDHAYVWNKDDEVLQFLKEKKYKVFDMGHSNPTAESMSSLLYGIAKDLLQWVDVERVIIYETPTSFAEYSDYYDI